MRGTRRGPVAAAGTAVLLALAAVLSPTLAAPPRSAAPPGRVEAAAAEAERERRAVELPSGVRYVELEPGEGDPARRGHRITVHLVGALASGEVVVSTRERRRPMRFRLGDGEVIRGLEEGIEGMRARGRRRVVVPPEAAYGRRGVGERIPPDAVLVFDVELLEIR